MGQKHDGRQQRCPIHTADATRRDATVELSRVGGVCIGLDGDGQIVLFGGLRGGGLHPAQNWLNKSKEQLQTRV